MKITISGNNLKHLRLVQKLAEELGLKIKTGSYNLQEKDIDEVSEKDNSEKLYQLMEEMAADNAFSEIKDPVEWQREIRKERTLPGRE